MSEVIFVAKPRFVVEIGEVGNAWIGNMFWTFAAAFTERHLATGFAVELSESNEHVRVVDRAPGMKEG